jgi:hypothetical protein
MAEIEQFVEFSIMGKEFLAALDYAQCADKVPQAIIHSLKQNLNKKLYLDIPDYETVKLWQFDNDYDSMRLAISFSREVESKLYTYLNYCYKQRKKQQYEGIREHYHKHLRRYRYGKNSLV